MGSVRILFALLVYISVARCREEAGRRRIVLRSIMSLGAASAWMVIGRASGLLWTMALIFTLGIDDYGRYA